MRVNTGGRRNEIELTAEQLSEAVEYAVRLGMPADRIYYNSYDCTAYGQRFDLLRIGTDILPVGKRSEEPNDNISLKGAIAHEIVGHRDAALKNMTQTDDLLEEVQASIRAAKFAPELSNQERLDLLKDAVARLKKNNIKLNEIRHKLYINER